MTAHALTAVSDTDPFGAPSPGDELVQRLEDPRIVASLSLILDHADLIATLIASLDGVIRRGEVIGDSLASFIDDFKTAGGPVAGRSLLPGVDVARLQTSASSLASAFIDATPTIDKLLHSSLTDAQTAYLLADLGEAVLAGKAAAEADPRGPKGIFALMRVTKDPDVSRGLGFMIHVARAFGKRLAQEPPDAEPGPRHSAR
ncbi:DUF1641 domain-containing protein [Mycobacterium lehmannii]|uniref:DUF1641 domain-containing protein n=1 Tax=Mycobacterium lehmannii TaxID=2048550 RepID=UPI000B93E450|nr:DUF1641 domain-containing protein [Mycobacterium lehmannii]